MGREELCNEVRRLPRLGSIGVRIGVGVEVGVGIKGAMRSSLPTEERV